jgi:hypothetical protein
MKELAGGDASNLDGWETLKPGAREQVEKSFEIGDVFDREYTGGALTFVEDAEDCVVEHAKSGRAACRADECKDKIAKGDIRLGVISPPLEDAKYKSSWKYAHW